MTRAARRITKPRYSARSFAIDCRATRRTTRKRARILTGSVSSLPMAAGYGWRVSGNRASDRSIMRLSHNRGDLTGPATKAATAQPDFTRKPTAALLDLEFTGSET